MKIQKR
jgi:hypothetical protein